MRIAVAADPFAVDLKNAVQEHLEGKGHVVLDVGTTGQCDVAYFDAAPKAVDLLQGGQADGAVLFCGTGAGMAIVANKFKGVRAVCVESVFAARMARAINDANVLTMGAMIVGPWMAKEMVDAWLETAHTQGLDAFAGFLKEAVQKVNRIDATQRG